MTLMSKAHIGFGNGGRIQKKSLTVVHNNLLYTLILVRGVFVESLPVRVNNI